VELFASTEHLSTLGYFVERLTGDLHLAPSFFNSVCLNRGNE
jgi:hypothetical protein